MNAAWRAFAKYKNVLCSKKYPLASRLKLFDSVVTPSALYACSTWTLRVADTQKVRTTWRKMMRNIFQVPRRDSESWVQYVKRSTRSVCLRAAQLRATDWVLTQTQRKQRTFDQLHSCDSSKWSSRLLSWKPWFRTEAHRRQGRPVLRWSDDFK